MPLHEQIEPKTQRRTGRKKAIRLEDQPEHDAPEAHTGHHFVPYGTGEVECWLEGTRTVQDPHAKYKRIDKQVEQRYVPPDEIERALAHRLSKAKQGERLRVVILYMENPKA